MDYLSLANELLNIRTNLLQVPADRKLSSMLRGELFVLNYLNGRDTPVHPKELSEKLSVSTARIATLLNHMEEKKLVIRTADPADSRQVIVRLTAEGAMEIARARKDVLTYLSGMLESLGPDDAQEYLRIQARIYANYLQK